MKKLALTFLILFTTKTYALEYSDNRCIYSGKDLPRVQRGFEAILGEFKKSQTTCCLHAVVSACDDGLVASVCKANVKNKVDGACPKECSDWASDCGDYVSASDLKDVKFKDKHEVEE